MLNIKNLEAKVDNKYILNGLNLDIKPGEVHAIMGPNGSGKSTLANVLSGKNGYETKGEIKFDLTKPDGTPQKFLDSTKIKKLGFKTEINLKKGLIKTYQEYLKFNAKN